MHRRAAACGNYEWADDCKTAEAGFALTHVRAGPVGTTIGRICTAKLPDTALHSGIIAPWPGGTAISRMTRKKQDRSR